MIQINKLYFPANSLIIYYLRLIKQRCIVIIFKTIEEGAKFQHAYHSEIIINVLRILQP